MAMKRRKRKDKSIGGKTPLIFFPSASYSGSTCPRGIKISWNYSKSQRHSRLASSIQKLVDIKIEFNSISKGVDDRSLRSISKDYYQIGHLLKLTMLMSQSISTREQKNLAQMQGPCGVDGTFHSWSLVALVVRMLIATAIRPFLKQPILSIAQFTSRRVRCKCGGTSEQYLL